MLAFRLATLSFLGLIASTATAAPFRYVIDGFGFGTLNGTRFGYSTFVFEGRGDTDNLYTNSYGAHEIVLSNGRITVDGLGSDTITSSLVATAFPRLDGAMDLSLGTGSFHSRLVVFSGGPYLANYRLDRNIGVFSSSVSNTGGSYTTSRGAFEIGFMGFKSGSFSSQALPVPEPGTFAAVAFGGAILVRRRRSGSERS